MRKTISILFTFVLLLFFQISVSYAITSSGEIRFEGIDVSNWQGYIDYSRVRNSGIDIVYIKASQGTNFKDPFFDYNYEKAKENGLRVGFYHFLTATNVEDARQEARFFSSVIAGKTPDCKLAMDFEQFRDGITTSEINEISEVFLQTVQSLTGKEMIVYSDLSNSRDVFNRQLAERYPLWFAYYGDYETLGDVETSWQTWEGVQYTSTGIVPGINGYVDRNRFTEDILLDESSNIPQIENPPDNFNTREILYTVVRGDTLSEIAQRFGTTVQQIASVNGIQNPNLIFPGQVFRIFTNSNINGNVTNETSHVVYTVRRGNTLSGIARRFGVSVQSIVNLNQIPNPNLIFPGQKFRIPVTENSRTNL